MNFESTNNLRRCIRCGIPKPDIDFNVEHIFPDTIGGTFKTDKVCIICNSLLNRKVDEPFVKSNFVLHYRHVYKLKKDSRRNIPNIVKGPIKDPEGNDRIVKYVDGQLKTELVEKFSYKVLEDGRLECKLTFDGINGENQDAIIKEHLQKLSKELNLDLGTEYLLGNVEKNDAKPFELILTEPTNYLIRECIKIAYEFACISQPRYIDDETAKQLVSFAVSETVTDEIKERINSVGTNKLKKYEERLALFNLQLHQHAIFIENISGDGVYAAVKIFNYVYPIKLSSNTELFAREDFILVNDILTKSIFTNHTLYYQTETFSVDFANLNIDAQEKIKKSGDSYFEQINSSLIFYKADGKVRYENVTSLCSQIVKRERLFEKNIGEKFTLDLSERNLHIKTTDNSFVKVLSITVTSFIVIHHLPKLQQTPGK